MSEKQVEIVQSMYAAFSDGDADDALAHFDPDVRVDVTRRVDGGRGQGRQELAALIGQWVATFENWREDIEEIRDLDPFVCVVATQRGRGKGSGLDVETRYAVIYEVRAGKIVSMTLFPDPGEALAAAGADG